MKAIKIANFLLDQAEFLALSDHPMHYSVIFILTRDEISETPNQYGQ